MNESIMRRVGPVRPVAGYVGGKKQLARTIVGLIDEIPHATYAEAFVGMGGVFFRRPKAPKCEVINDANEDVACLFRILQRHFEPFLDILKWRLTSRSEWQRLNNQDPKTLTDLERAARFLYLQRLSFGGKVAGRSFGIDTHGPARFDVTKLAIMLDEVRERLAGVWIECLQWPQFIERWDRPETLFYLDPPYVGTEHFYGRELFDAGDHARLAKALRAIRGRFVLSLNDVPLVRELYSWATVREVELSYTAGGGENTMAAKELIVIGAAGSGEVPELARQIPLF